MKRSRPSMYQAGFTLIELMVVIVIISLLASLILLNIDGVDQRKAMQARESLILDLKKINREANDQSRIYALGIQSATDVSAFRYTVLEYKNTLSHKNSRIQIIEQNKWKAVPDFPMRTLPDRVSFRIEPVDYTFENANNGDLTGTNAPQLIWFGNGEVKPVRIQMYYDQKPVGEMIQVDYLGKVDEKN
nr:prepilin-type N-terminal cleavage/methylation domain-containing protein [Acinetobacter sp. Marseille-Q1620]